MSARILVVDDDPPVLSGLRRALILEGYAVIAAEDGGAALARAGEQEFDLVVLDILLPGLDGYTICQRLRATSMIPILMLSAKDTVPDRIAGLDRGADDYLVKPFALDELLARVRALLRRSNPESEHDLRYADVILDLATRQAGRGAMQLTLSQREVDLLAFFLHHPRRVLSREQLCRQVWGYTFGGESNFIDVAVMELRKKLESGGAPRLIQTIRGYGYALREE